MTNKLQRRGGKRFVATIHDQLDSDTEGMDPVEIHPEVLITQELDDLSIPCCNGTTEAAGGAATFAGIQLWNPHGSGVVLLPSKVIFWPEGVATDRLYALRYETSARANAALAPAQSMQREENGQYSPAGQVNSDTSANGTFISYWVAYDDFLGEEIRFDKKTQIWPGTALSVDAPANQPITAAWFWSEAPRSGH